MRRFRVVGLADYRKFVQRFSSLAAPLTTICSPRARFSWGAAEQASFDVLKVALTLAPVLRVWPGTLRARPACSRTLRNPPCLQSSSSPTTLVCFESRKLIKPQRQYPPHLLELLAVVHALKTLRPGYTSSCTRIMPACSGYNSGATAVITRHAGLTS